MLLLSLDDDDKPRLTIRTMSNVESMAAGLEKISKRMEDRTNRCWWEEMFEAAAQGRTSCVMTKKPVAGRCFTELVAGGFQVHQNVWGKHIISWKGGAM